MGKSGFKGGNLYAQNKQSGVITVSTDGSGNGSSDISFDHKVQSSDYSVNLTPLQGGSEVWSSGTLMGANRTVTGCTVYVRGCSETNDVVKISYEIMDDNYK